MRIFESCIDNNNIGIKLSENVQKFSGKKVLCSSDIYEQLICVASKLKLTKLDCIDRDSAIKDYDIIILSRSMLLYREYITKVIAFKKQFIVVFVDTNTNSINIETSIEGLV